MSYPSAPVKMTSTQILIASGVGAQRRKILSVVFTMKMDFCLLDEDDKDDAPDDDPDDSDEGDNAEAVFRLKVDVFVDDDVFMAS